MFTDNQAVQFRVMANDRLLVAGAANVKLKPIGGMFQGQVKGGECVLRRIPAGAAMSEQ
jgi:hypothetical protein